MQDDWEPPGHQERAGNNLKKRLHIWHCHPLFAAVRKKAKVLGLSDELIITCDTIPAAITIISGPPAMWA
ncbi:MAG: hypothetical protein Q8N94_07130 [Methanoregula sp.]|nr:hypothetical protein [Methanoregula sp.]